MTDPATFRAEAIEAMAASMCERRRQKTCMYPTCCAGPYQCDVAEEAKRILAALSTVAEKHGLKLMGREPSEAMLSALHPGWPLQRIKDETDAEDDWRAMHDAAVSLLEGPK